jgi:IclR family transcriptional regulator, KDG regulon repressor
MNNTHQSVGRALEILLGFIPHNQEMRAVEISKNLGLHPSTVNRLLHVITRYGFLQQDRATRKYRLGESAVDMGKAIAQSFREHLVEIAKPQIDNLRNIIGDTISLEVMLGDTTTVAYRARGPHRIQVLFDPGERLPVHVAAGAKTILAFSPPGAVDKLIHGKLARLTRNTITNPEILKVQLDEIKRQGFAFDNKELDIHIQAVAAPIFDHQKKPVAAVVLSAPVFRMKAHLKTNAIALVQQTAKKISQLVFSDGQFPSPGETAGVSRRKR